MHFLHEGALSQDGAHEIDAKDAGIVPVVTEYLSNRDETALCYQRWPLLLRVDKGNFARLLHHIPKPDFEYVNGD
jgi:hypothetical protein